ncbi:MAG: TauD/TfdA family dioxygenase [Novosphingobium sp.]
MTCCNPMPFTVTPVGERDVPGVMVTDLAPERISDPAVAGMLRALWQAHGLIVFRGLSGTETHLELSRVFGTLTSHPSGVSHNARHPELSDIAHTLESGNIVRIEGREIGAYLPWHSDLVYFAEINHGGILRALEPSRESGMTGFVDKIAAWERLPDALKARCRGLSVIYWGDFRIESCRYARGATQVQSSASHQRIVAKRDQFPRVAHPLVCEVPGSGKTMLNFSPWFALGIEGMADGEALPLLDELAAHIDGHSGAYFHQWLPDDMVLWDNWRMLHCATGVPAEDRRIMQRTTIMGDYGLGRVVAETAESSTLERVSV